MQGNEGKGMRKLETSRGVGSRREEKRKKEFHVRKWEIIKKRV